MITVGSRLTDFATASHSLFANPDVRFASINVDARDGDRLGAVSVLGDAKLPWRHWHAPWPTDDVTSGRCGASRVEAATARGPRSGLPRSTPTRSRTSLRCAQQTTDVIPDTDAVLTQAQLIGLLQEHARSGDTIIAAAGGPPGDLLKVWDATDGRECHLEFGFSCMGYEIPAAIGVRLADARPCRTGSPPSSATAPS